MSAQVISLGCRLNISESAQIRSMLRQESNLVVINSCAVTAEAVKQTRQAIRKARRSNPEARLLVTGCAADIERSQLGQMPEVDGIISNRQKLDHRAWNVPAAAPVPVEDGHTRAFVAVQNGCDHSCTFCVIPQGRGESRSLPIPDVLAAVARHLDHGAPEIVLTGVDVTSWGHDLPGSPSLGRLVRSLLDEFPHLRRLRMSSLDGVEIDDELIELFASEDRVMPHLHLSMQSGDDLTLKRMKRRHSRADAVKLVETLKSRRPDLAIGADIIAGFPTETDAMHANNLSIIGALGIVHGHIFPYSPRPGTPASRMPQVAQPLIKARAAELRAEVSRIREEWLGKLVGTPLSVLCERDGTGHAENFARVALPQGAVPGSVITITPKRLEEGLLK